LNGKPFLVLYVIILLARVSTADWLFVPMDKTQQDHLRAYGFAYSVLENGENVEWLLNISGGSFLVRNTELTKQTALILGVSTTPMTSSEVVELRATVESSNAKSILLEKAPRIAVYCPPSAEPWDDAVRLALEYAHIPYDTIWDDDILSGILETYDWLHLHHEDFTGQYGKFFAAFGQADWYRARQKSYELNAQKNGFKKVSDHKCAVAMEIRRYVDQGGFLFAMCSATDTVDIALAAHNVDIVDQTFDGDPPDPVYQKHMDYGATFAFTSFRVYPNPLVYEFSDIDTTQDRPTISRDLDRFHLFEFSAEFDPVPCMLTQCHERYVKGFMGQTTGYHASFIKPDVVILADTPNSDEVKYIHGNLGRGTFTFLGGHDPEDYQHIVGDPPTDLNLVRNSPGYRLILNNVLFPAARKQERKT